MKIRKMICAMLLAALLAGCACAHAATIQLAWMEYEDYSGGRAEQRITSDATLQELEQILVRASKNPAKLDNCTMNCTLFCMIDDEIFDFACATDGCPYIQTLEDEKVYTLGDDFERFWELFSDVRDGMGYDASAVFDW